MPKKSKKPKKPEKSGKKPGKSAQKAKKADVKRGKSKKRDKAMVGPDKTPNQREEERKAAEKTQAEAKKREKPQDTGNPREGERGSEINKDKPLTPSGEPAGAFIDQEDPMGTPANSPLSPTEAMRQNQTDEVDLRGSPGAAGEYVPVSGPGNNDTNDMTHEHGQGERADPPPIYTEAEEEDADKPGVKRKK